MTGCAFVRLLVGSNFSRMDYWDGTSSSGGGDGSEGVPGKLIVIMGIMLGLAVAFYAGSVLLDRKSTDGLYDLDDAKYRTSSSVEQTPDLFKGKHALIPADAPVAEPQGADVAAPAPVKKKPLFPVDKGDQP